MGLIEFITKLFHSSDAQKPVHHLLPPESRASERSEMIPKPDRLLLDGIAARLNNRKIKTIYVFDTNVPVRFPYSFYTFTGNDVPEEIMDEITKAVWNPDKDDKKQNEPNAVCLLDIVHSELNHLKSNHRMSDLESHFLRRAHHVLEHISSAALEEDESANIMNGIDMENKGVLFKMRFQESFRRFFPLDYRPTEDNFIAQTTRVLSEFFSPYGIDTVFVSGDVYARTIAMQECVKVQKFRFESVDFKNLPTGRIQITVGKSMIEQYKRDKFLSASDLSAHPMFTKFYSNAVIELIDEADGEDGEVQAYGFWCLNNEMRDHMYFKPSHPKHEPPRINEDKYQEYKDDILRLLSYKALEKTIASTIKDAFAAVEKEKDEFPEEAFATLHESSRIASPLLDDMEKRIEECMQKSVDPDHLFSKRDVRSRFRKVGYKLKEFRGLCEDSRKKQGPIERPTVRLPKLVEEALDEFESSMSDIKKQYMELLENPGIKLVSCIGAWGTGKTICALVAGLRGIQRGLYPYVRWSMPLGVVGDEMGFLPGNKDAKYKEHSHPVIDALRSLMKYEYTSTDRRKQIDETITKMRAEGYIQIEPVTYLTGRNLGGYLILDEAHKTTREMIAVIISRAHEAAKTVVVGDPDQVMQQDARKGIERDTCGIVHLPAKCIGDSIYAHCYLPDTEIRRSAVSRIAKRL